MMPRWQRSQKGRVCNMRYHNITKDDMLNGDGLRVVLWVAGCSHGCPGCHNPVTWDAGGGLPFDEAAQKEIEEQLEKEYISGITYSGGDPLHKANKREVTALAKRFREKFPHKSQWLYTGYCWEEIMDEEILSYVDVVVDGRFEEALKDTQLHWKGSANQRVIDVRESLQTGKIVLHSR